MKKLTNKMWWYGINFLLRAILFNLAFGFGITALILKSDGLSKWAIISIISACVWFLEILNVHLTWFKMSLQERSLYLAIRKHGKGLVHLTSAEVKNKLGQKTAYEFLTDTDIKIEIGMLINGTATLINVFIGTKWIIDAKHFNSNEGVFDYIVDGFVSIKNKSVK